MAFNLPPPPVSNDPKDPSFRDWFYKLQKAFTTLGSFLYTNLDFTGSNLTSILTRNHNDLQNNQGGTSAQYYHLTSSEYTGTGTGNFVRETNPTISSPNVDDIDFDTATASVGAVGRLKWNDTDGTLELGLKGGNVTLQIGQEQNLLVKHADSTGLTNGTAVYTTGSSGANILVREALGTTHLANATIGVMTETVTGGEKGFVTTFGLVRDIDTSALTEGAIVYVSASVAGGLTTTQPTPPNHTIKVGICVRSHAVVGALFVNVNAGHEIEDLHNVLITSPAAGNTLIYDASLSLWKNAPITAGTNITVTNSDASITVAAQVKIYENIVTAGFNNNVGYLAADPLIPDLMTDANGDIVMAWSGEYAS